MNDDDLETAVEVASVAMGVGGAAEPQTVNEILEGIWPVTQEKWDALPEAERAAIEAHIVALADEIIEDSIVLRAALSQRAQQSLEGVLIILVGDDD